MSNQKTAIPATPGPNCCDTTNATTRPCPRCGHVGPIVGTAPVRAHRPEAADGGWQYCANQECAIVFHLGADIVETDSVRTQVGFKATGQAMPVCFCFAHTASAIGDDLVANDGVSEIKASVKAAVADGHCACDHLNPNGTCCLADIHRTLKTFIQPKTFIAARLRPEEDSAARTAPSTANSSTSARSPSNSASPPGNSPR